MARPRKEHSQDHRLPTWHAGRKCWRLRINHHHGEKTFEWSAPFETPACPPSIIAAAVAVQDQWRQLVSDWPNVSFYLQYHQPDRDWTRPVWLTPDQIAAAKAHVEGIRNENRRRVEVSAAYDVAAIGIDRLTDVLARLTPGSAENPGGPWEANRLSMLAALRPARRVVQTVTVREAMRTYLAYHEGRTKLKAGDWIKPSTFNQMRKTLLAALGLSSSPKMQPVRDDVKLDLDQPLSLLDDAALDGFARFWHSMPAGVDSTRTIRNRLHAAREFFNWCGRQKYGFTFCLDVAKIYTAEDVETPAKPYDAEQIKRILREGKTRGGQRLRLYVLLGLLCGYYQTDCCEITESEYLIENGEVYIHRFRSKERRPKRGSRPIRVKHWIPPELADLTIPSCRHSRGREYGPCLRLGTPCPHMRTTSRPRTIPAPRRT